MEFHALHISDIHFDHDSSSDAIEREKILQIIEEKQLSADCLIISGDLFNRGSLKESELTDVRSFIERLPGNKFTIVVPGNHDVDRSAKKKKDNSYNVYTTRFELVFDFGEKVLSGGKDSEFVLSNDEKDILYIQSFQAFFSFAQSIGSRSFNNVNPLSHDNYEVEIISCPLADDTSHCITFVLLNTALIAGQAVRDKEYRRRLLMLKQEYQKKLDENIMDEAAKIALNIALIQNRFEKDGEFIIDEEPSPNTLSGRMSLSQDGSRFLSKINKPGKNGKTSIPDGTILTVFVGHHGFQYLSKQTQNCLKEAMQSTNSGLYLCGHAHEVSFNRHKIVEGGATDDVRQFQSGVLFHDNGGFAEYGFNYITVKTDQFNKNLLQCITRTFRLVESVASSRESKKFTWFEESFVTTIPIFRRVPTGGHGVDANQQETTAEEVLNPTETSLYKDNTPNTGDPNELSPYDELQELFKKDEGGTLYG